MLDEDPLQQKRGWLHKWIGTPVLLATSTMLPAISVHRPQPGLRYGLGPRILRDAAHLLPENGILGFAAEYPVFQDESDDHQTPHRPPMPATPTVCRSSILPNNSVPSVETPDVAAVVPSAFTALVEAMICFASWFGGSGYFLCSRGLASGSKLKHISRPGG